MYSGHKFNEDPTIEDQFDTEDALIDEQPGRDGTDDELTSLISAHENLRRQVALLNAQLAEKQQRKTDRSDSNQRPTNSRPIIAVAVAMLATGIFLAKSF